VVAVLGRRGDYSLEQDTLQFRVFINLLQVHDFSLPEEDSRSDNDDFWFNPNQSCTFRPWPSIRRYATGAVCCRPVNLSLACHREAEEHAGRNG
jgi:hypothetical protein